jgi:hypothetical protein
MAIMAAAARRRIIAALFDTDDAGFDRGTFS